MGPATAGPNSLAPEKLLGPGAWPGAEESLHHPAHVRHAAAAAVAVLLRDLGDDRLGREDVLGDRGRVLQRRARHHRRVDDPRRDEIDDLTRGGVQALAFLGLADVVDHDRALEAGVLGQLTERLLERPQHDPCPGPLVVGPVLAGDGPVVDA